MISYSELDEKWGQVTQCVPGCTNVRLLREIAKCLSVETTSTRLVLDNALTCRSANSANAAERLEASLNRILQILSVTLFEKALILQALQPSDSKSDLQGNDSQPILFNC